MKIAANQLYHIYNQGNNKEKIFYARDNYIYFLKKVKTHIFPVCKILAYCLMPNHFHFLIYTTEESVKEMKSGNITLTKLSNAFKVQLSSYSQAINKAQNRTGSLFRQRTKAKLLDNNDDFYPEICFNYIHQNPYLAGMVKKLEDWEFSSFRDYTVMRNGKLCDKNFAMEILDLPKDNFYQYSYEMIDNEKVKKFRRKFG